MSKHIICVIRGFRNLNTYNHLFGTAWSAEVYKRAAFALIIFAFGANSAFGSCTGDACNDVSFRYENGCYKTTNKGKRKIKVWLGVFGFELLPNQAQTLTLNGKCVQVYAGGEKANYMDSPSSQIGTGGSSRKPGLEEMFPRPDAGRKMHFIMLPSVERESVKKIQLIVGARVQVDDCNSYWIHADVAEDRASISGRVYRYFSVENVNIGSTLAGCYRIDPPFQESMIWKELYLAKIPPQPYKGDFPLVVYTPSNFIVKYKVLTPSGSGWVESNEIVVPEK